MLRLDTFTCYRIRRDHRVCDGSSPPPGSISRWLLILHASSRVIHKASHFTRSHPYRTSQCSNTTRQIVSLKTKPSFHPKIEQSYLCLASDWTWAFIIHSRHFSGFFPSFPGEFTSLTSTRTQPTAWDYSSQGLNLRTGTWAMNTEMSSFSRGPWTECRPWRIAR